MTHRSLINSYVCLRVYVSQPPNTSLSGSKLVDYSLIHSSVEATIRANDH